MPPLELPDYEVIKEIKPGVELVSLNNNQWVLKKISDPFFIQNWKVYNDLFIDLAKEDIIPSFLKKQSNILFTSPIKGEESIFYLSSYIEEGDSEFSIQSLATTINKMHQVLNTPSIELQKQFKSRISENLSPWTSFKSQRAQEYHEWLEQFDKQLIHNDLHANNLYHPYILDFDSLNFSNVIQDLACVCFRVYKPGSKESLNFLKVYNELSFTNYSYQDLAKTMWYRSYERIEFIQSHPKFIYDLENQNRYMETAEKFI